MQRINTANKSANLFGTGKHGYKDGSPGLTGATELDSAAMNAIQEEVSRAVETVGAVALDGANYGQLADAILAGIQARREQEVMLSLPAGFVSHGSGAWMDAATDGAGKIVIVGSSGKVSTAGFETGSFTARTPAASFAGGFTRVIWVASLGLFVATGAGPSNAGTIQTSPDGVTWTQRSSAMAFYWVVNLGGTLVAYGYDGTTNYSYTSTNGTGWTQHALAVALSRNGAASASASMLVCGGGGFGTSTSVYSSTDGITFTARTLGSSDDMTTYSLAYCSAGFFVAAGRDSTDADAIVQVSTNGTTWTRAVRITGANSTSYAPLALASAVAVHVVSWPAAASSSLGEHTITLRGAALSGTGFYTSSGTHTPGAQAQILKWHGRRSVVFVPSASGFYVSSAFLT